MASAIRFQIYFLVLTSYFGCHGWGAEPPLRLQAQLSLIVDLELAAPVAARVKEVRVREGDRVVQGQVIVQLDQDLAVEELAAAQQDAKAARMESENDVDERYAIATRNVHRNELERLQQANQSYQHSISKTELDRCALEIHQAELALEQAVHRRQLAGLMASKKSADAMLAEKKLELLTIRAPVDGYVMRVDAKPGVWIVAGGTVARIIDPMKLRAEAYVDGGMASQAWVGKSMRFESEGLSESVAKGTVMFVSPELHPVTGQVRIACEIQNEGYAFRPGMHGMIAIE